MTLNSGCFYVSSIKTLKFPDSLTTIEDASNEFQAVFQNCKSLTEVTISKASKLKTIGASAFVQAALTKFFIPKGVDYIGHSSFALCPIQNLTCDNDNPNFFSDGRALYSKDGTILYSVSSYDFGENFVVNENVSIINSNAFRGVPGNTLIFKNQNVEISSSAFLGIYVKNITFSSGQSTVVSSCFTASRIEYVILHNGITRIENNAFSRCSALKEVIMEEGLTFIGNSAFLECYNVKLTIPSSVTSVGISCFSNIPIENIKFLNPLFHIKDEILYYNDSLVDYIGTSESNVTSIPGSTTSIQSYMFYQKKLKSVSFEEPSSCKEFGSLAFAESTLVSIVFPSSLKTLSMCFMNCKKLQSVQIRGSFNSIPTQCFYSCELLEKISFQESNSIVSIGNSAFYQCSLLNFNFSQLHHLETIEQNAFPINFNINRLILFFFIQC